MTQDAISVAAVYLLAVPILIALLLNTMLRSQSKAGESSDFAIIGASTVISVIVGSIAVLVTLFKDTLGVVLFWIPIFAAISFILAILTGFAVRACFRTVRTIGLDNDEI